MPELPDELRRVLDNLPQGERRGRSRLEPFRAYILRWHRDGRSYREIQEILREHCGIRISPQSIHQYVRRKSRPRKQVAVDAEVVPQRETKPVQEKQPAPSETVNRWTGERDLRTQKPKVFDYDESIPPINKNFWRKSD